MVYKKTIRVLRLNSGLCLFPVVRLQEVKAALQDPVSFPECVVINTYFVE